MANKTFLKWAGNKSKIIPIISSYIIKDKFTRLVEPFMGSGSFMLNHSFSQYFGSDINLDLISLFQHLQLEQEAFIDYCSNYFTIEFFGEKQYYEIRELFNSTCNQREKSALFLYLNKYGFNGLCRYNKHGKFTTPFCHTTKLATFPYEQLKLASEKIINYQFKCQSFEKTLEETVNGDIVYCDPPYLPLERQTATFTSYSSGDFNLNEHKLLRDYAIENKKNDITTIISNHDSELTRKLYQDANLIVELDVYRSMGRYENNVSSSAKEILAIYGEYRIPNMLTSKIQF